MNRNNWSGVKIDRNKFGSRLSSASKEGRSTSGVRALEILSPRSNMKSPTLSSYLTPRNTSPKFYLNRNNSRSKLQAFRNYQLDAVKLLDNRVKSFLAKHMRIWKGNIEIYQKYRFYAGRKTAKSPCRNQPIIEVLEVFHHDRMNPKPYKDKYVLKATSIVEDVVLSRKSIGFQSIFQFRKKRTFPKKVLKIDTSELSDCSNIYTGIDELRGRMFSNRNSNRQNTNWASSLLKPAPRYEKFAIKLNKIGSKWNINHKKKLFKVLKSPYIMRDRLIKVWESKRQQNYTSFWLGLVIKLKNQEKQLQSMVLILQRRQKLMLQSAFDILNYDKFQSKQKKKRLTHPKNKNSFQNSSALTKEEDLKVVQLNEIFTNIAHKQQRLLFQKYKLKSTSSMLKSSARCEKIQKSLTRLSQMRRLLLQKSFTVWKTALPSEQLEISKLASLLLILKHQRQRRLHLFWCKFMFKLI